MTEVVVRKPTLKDYLGRVIEPGMTLVYPVRRGSGMWLRRMVVQCVTSGGVVGDNEDGRRVTVTKPERSVVVEG